MKRTLTLLAAAILSAAPAAAQMKTLNGAGATFPYPIYSKWFDEYHKVKPDLQINYQSIGSGGGIRQVTEKTVDFGATDGPMTNQQQFKVDGKILHIPAVLGAVVPAYNLKGIELKRDGRLKKLLREFIRELNLSMELQANLSNLVVEALLNNEKKMLHPRLNK